MKRVIRQKKARGYLSADGRWETDFRLAEDFPNTQSAIDAVWRFDDKDDLELVFFMGETPSDEYDVALPLFPSRTHLLRPDPKLNSDPGCCVG